ncbi:SET domain containing [Geosmithia morbida]|uniref:SET domain containing n=1 Tax=Geosmithia morbida TaxID=1094350 RepID=A0A9P4Z1G4_9HYPO|nr:SET domain containing [Geosmithia morbida]KAF4125679.1 SET domain containing [Geosmithia morbida]
MPPPQAPPLPIQALPAWASLYDVNFYSVRLENMKGRGIGLAAAQPLSLAAGHEGATDDRPLLKVPRDLVLSIEAVEQYAKIDHHFHELLDATGHQTPRGHIVLYLLAHLASSKSQALGMPDSKIVSTGWTEYIKFLPREIPVPTLWTDAERSLLAGTSLESAVNAKMASLSNEFEQVRTAASGVRFWDALLGNSRAVDAQDWALVDAWYRSRCLELPSAGEAMVPCVDMANHSNEPDAYYDEDGDGNVEILLRPGFGVTEGDEVTISYGEFKSAAEMLFSYGFIDRDSGREEATLVLNSLPDDPLARAKVHVFGSLPTVRLSRKDGRVTWEAPFLSLACLNEEDGLDFRLLQDNEGGRELRVFWQEEDVTDRASDFQSLIKDHPIFAVFQLRMVAMLAQQLTSQLEQIQAPHIDEETDGSSPNPELRDVCVDAARMLREVEGSLLEGALGALQEQQTTLLADDKVKEYLGAAEAAAEDGQDQDPARPEAEVQ